MPGVLGFLEEGTDYPESVGHCAHTEMNCGSFYPGVGMKTSPLNTVSLRRHDRATTCRDPSRLARLVEMPHPCGTGGTQRCGRMPGERGTPVQTQACEFRISLTPIPQTPTTLGCMQSSTESHISQAVSSAGKTLSVVVFYQIPISPSCTFLLFTT